MRQLFFCLVLVFFGVKCGFGQNLKFKEHPTITTRYSNLTNSITSDLDQDGDLDILFGSKSGHSIEWLENKGNGNFQSKVITNDVIYGRSASSTGDANLESLNAGDLDGDGDLDIIFIYWIEYIEFYYDYEYGIVTEYKYESKIAWYENNGNGEFKSQQQYIDIFSASFPINSISSGDLNGDGDLDILAWSSGIEVFYYENKKNNEFNDRHYYNSNFYDVNSLKINDINGDGKLDIVTSSSIYKTNIIWHENIGDKQFKNHTISRVDVNKPQSINIGDLDGDGDLDVLSASPDEDKIAWYENKGEGVFEAHIITTDANGASSVNVGDLDGDGDLDIVSGSYSSIAWYENKGNGEFQTHTITTDANGANSVNVGDLDGDGDLDILYASSWSNKIVWYENILLNTNISGISKGDSINSPITVTIELNMEVEDLTLDDIIISNGTASNLQKVESSHNYTVVVTPDQDGEFTITIPEGSFSSREATNKKVSITANYFMPVVTSVVPSSPNTYLFNEKLNFTVNFSENINLEGYAFLAITYNNPEGITGQWVAESISQTDSSLIFEYIIQNGNEDLDGITLDIDALTVEGSIMDNTGKNAILKLNNIGDLTNIFVNARANTPSITNTATDEDTQTTTGLVISRNESDGEEVTHFQITNISNGTVYQNDGITKITSNSFISFEEALAGLKFTPSENYYGTATFDIQSSLNARTSGLGGMKTRAEIIISPINDLPELVKDIDDIFTTYGNEKTQEVDIKYYLSDVDDNISDLTYTPVSNNENTATISETNGVLTINFHHTGEATITVTVTDLDGGQLTTDFKVIVEPAPLTITPNNKKREYGFINPKLDGRYEGLQYDDAIDSIEYYTDATTYSEVGFHPIYVGEVVMKKGELSDYEIIRNEGEMEIFSTNRIFIPTLFSPNGDGSNDTFFISSKEIKNILFKIYDRSGALLFETSSIEKAISTGWNGKYNDKEIPAGNYVWQISGTFTDGQELNFKGKNTGIITLIR